MEKKVKIQIVRQESNMVGDTVCIIPMVKALKKKYPDSYLALVYGWSHYEVPYQKIIPELDEVLFYDNSSLKSKMKLLIELRKKKFDIGIVPSTVKISANSHIINFLSGAKKRIGVKSIDGKKNKTHFLLNIKSDFDWNKKQTHQTQRGLDIVRQIGCDMSEDEIKNIHHNISEPEKIFAEEFFKKHFPDKSRLIIGFHPGAGKIENKWGYENFAELIEMIYKKYNSYILITTGVTDKKTTNQLTEILDKKNIPYVVLCENTGNFIAVIIRISLYITNDTGSMHLAWLSGVRIISLFLQSNFYKWKPLSDGCKSVVSSSENINEIKVSEVFKIVKEMIVK
jgi:heptosyltransferase-2